MSDLKPGKQSSILATSLTQTGVDVGEVVERVFDGGGVEDSGRAVNREERIGSTTGTTRASEAPEDALKPELLAKDLHREGDIGMRDRSENETVADGGLAGKKPAMMERKKKRRKKGNAIDELFAGLS